MLKTLYEYLAGLIVLVPLVIFVTPLLYGMAWLLAAAIPLAFVVMTLDDAWHGTQSIIAKEVLAKFVLAVFVAPLAILAIAAPLRAVMLATLSFFPEWMAKFDEIHGYLYDWLAPVFGNLSPYWLDVCWGLLGMGTIFLLALGDSIRRNKLNRQIEILPTSSIRSVAIGLAELKGKAVPLGRKSAGKPIMRRWRESTSDGSRWVDHVEPFLLDDGTDRILVDPRGVSVQGSSSYFQVGMHQAILKELDPRDVFTESRLMPGDDVYLVGNVQINDDREDADYEADYGEVVVKPKRSSWFSMNFYDLFFISNISEEALLASFRKSVKRGWSMIVVVMLFGAWLSIFALTNVLQIESSDIEAAPEYLRFVSTPTTLERQVRVPGVGRNSTLEFMKMLEEGDPDKSDAIMGKLHELKLTRLVLPLLTSQATNIDHRGFGIANYWLDKLDERPAKLWGVEFMNSTSKYSNNHYVERLMTRYDDNRLFVSYRAVVLDKPPSKRLEFEGRHVVIELVHKETGKKYEAEFKAEIGINEAVDVEAFEFLYPGDYEIAAFVRTSYRSGAKYIGFMTRKPYDIRLEG